MLREGIIFVLGSLTGSAVLLAFFLLPVWLHAKARKRALRARMDGPAERWLH